MGAILTRLRGLSSLPLRLRAFFDSLLYRALSRLRPLPPPYEYSPLGPRGIRILAIYRPRREYEDLTLRLIPYSLDKNIPAAGGSKDQPTDTGGAFTYDALSYVWEADVPENRTHLVCDGHTISNVPRNLLAFLQCLQRTGFRRGDGSIVEGPLYIWADSVCINQSSNTEKARQVALMAEIYSRAKNVLVWLGVPFGATPEEEKDFALRALGMIEETKALLPAISIDDPNAMHASSLASMAPQIAQLEKMDWVPLRLLFSSPWFDRKWIVQEAALAKNALVMIGGLVLPLGMLADMASLLVGHGFYALPVFRGLLPDGMTLGIRLYNLTHIRGLAHFREKRQLTFLDTVKMTRQFRCTRPEDHVYATLALSPENDARDATAPNSAIKILQRDDMYDIPPAEVFARFCKYNLENGDLGFLSMAPHCDFPPSFAKEMSIPEVPHLALPSWVPDLRRQKVDVLSSHSMKMFHFDAGGRDLGPGKYQIAGNVFSCRGWAVDVVADTIDCLVVTPKPPAPDIQPPHLASINQDTFRDALRQIAWYRDCARLACASSPGSGAEISDMSEERFDDFWKTITTGRLFLLDRVDPSVDYSAPMRKFFTGLQTLFSTEDAEVAAKAVEAYMPLAPTMDVNLSSNGFRRFASTRDGRLALCPDEAKPGDEFLILPGGEIPLVARRIGGCRFELIGDAYLSRMMDGEILTMGAQLEDIQFV